VSGRAKDLIIVGGANVHPHDVEAAAERSAAELRPGCSAAFGLERDGTEQVALAVEVDERADLDLAALHRKVRARSWTTQASRSTP
jgi:acyl-CoA synthetase (AMP-forming)/AMP-acid ligase II